MKQLFLFIFVLTQSIVFSQTSDTYEKSPVFPGCESQPIENLKSCFNNKINTHIFNTLKVPQVAIDDEYKGDAKVLFEVDKEGAIHVLYVDAVYDELKDEVKRVFNELPKTIPGTYNGNPTYYQYSLAIKIPLVNPQEVTPQTAKETIVDVKKTVDLNQVVSNEYDSINDNIVKYQKLEYKSQLNVPFTHTYYARLIEK